MALEPITRQEQIIAGKDLEPITRMEKFLKQYGGGSGGGGGAEIIEATHDPKNDTLILPVSTTKIYEMVASGKDVIIKAPIYDTDFGITRTVLFRLATFAVGDTVWFTSSIPKFTSSGAVEIRYLLQVYCGEEMTVADYRYIQVTMT